MSNFCPPECVTTAGVHGLNRSSATTVIPIPVKIWPNVRSALAASQADEPRLKIGQPDVIRPRIGAGRDVHAQ